MLAYLKFAIRTIKYWGIINFTKICYGEIINSIKGNKFDFVDKTEIDPTRTDINDHIPTPWYLLNNIYSYIKPFNLNENLFIDLGCGSGRVLKYFQNKNFNNLIGVELSERLITNAEKKLSNSQNITMLKLELINIDFTKYEFPDDTKIIYFHDPCAEKTTSHIANNIFKQFNKKQIIYLIYVSPKYVECFLKANFKIIKSAFNKYHRGYCIYQLN